MTQDDKPLGIGVIGLGMVAGAHARALKDLAGLVEVRGVFARDPGRRAAFGREHGFPVAASVDQLMADPTIGAILVLTPPNMRRDIVRAAAKAGKHVLLEKPIERDSHAALEIVEICERAGVRLGVVFQNRFRPAAAALRKLVEGGALGAVASAQVVVPWWREQSYYDEPGRGTYARDGGGVLISQAIHTLDLLLWFIGPPVEVQAVAGTTRLHRMEAEDFVSGGMRFAGGALGALIATTAAYPGAAEYIVIDFERCSVRLQGGKLDLCWHDGRTEQHGETTGTGGGADPMAFSHEWHRELIRDFVLAVRSGGEPMVTGREALRVHRLIDAVIASARQGTAITLAEEFNQTARSEA